MKRAVLYLRVSTQDQTTANQERELRDVAERDGWQIVDLYKDHGISGAKSRDKRPAFDVRRAKARFPSGGQTHPATFAPAGSNRSSRGGDETAEAFDVEGHLGDSASMRAATCSER